MAANVSVELNQLIKLSISIESLEIFVYLGYGIQRSERKVYSELGCTRQKLGYKPNDGASTRLASYFT
jgi:hypothetical protein